jgi:hypothetical protein
MSETARSSLFASSGRNTSASRAMGSSRMLYPDVERTSRSIQVLGVRKLGHHVEPKWSMKRDAPATNSVFPAMKSHGRAITAWQSFSTARSLNTRTTGSEDKCDCIVLFISSPSPMDQYFLLSVNSIPHIERSINMHIEISLRVDNERRNCNTSSAHRICFSTKFNDPIAAASAKAAAVTHT